MYKIYIEDLSCAFLSAVSGVQLNNLYTCIFSKTVNTRIHTHIHKHTQTLSSINLPDWVSVIKNPKS